MRPQSQPHDPHSVRQAEAGETAREWVAGLHNTPKNDDGVMAVYTHVKRQVKVHV